jgi:predicted N-acetyltransferase YhbS
MECVIRPATLRDVETVTRLINAAFQVERFFKRGDRTTEEGVRELLANGVVLLAEDLGARIRGSVYTEIRSDRLYIGMVSVDPECQGQGLGRMLMNAAEARGVAHGCTHADLTIVNLRTELPPFYRRFGYIESAIKPFEAQWEATRECHLIVMSKRLPTPV